MNENSSVKILINVNGNTIGPQPQTFIANTAVYDIVIYHLSRLSIWSTYKNRNKMIDYIILLEDLLASSF